MDETGIVKEISKTKKARAPLYLNNEKIGFFFSQKLGDLSNLVASKKLGSEISASLLKIIGSKVDSESGLEATIQLSPVIKAILLEAQAREAKELLDLAKHAPRQNSWLVYIGPGRFVIWNQKISHENSGLDEATAKVIQKEREDQEKMLRFWNDKIRTVVWLANAKGRTIASIASTDWINGNLFASYVGAPIQGILGRYEKKIEDIVFVSPFWIWGET
ncbi:MAG: hypothetical protein ACMUIU_13420 [bacterium]